jgi:hypothetical protein
MGMNIPQDCGLPHAGFPLENEDITSRKPAQQAIGSRLLDGCEFELVVHRVSTFSFSRSRARLTASS